MNIGAGNDRPTGCFEIKVWVDGCSLYVTTRISRLGKCGYIWSEKETFVKDETEIASRGC